MVPAVPRESSGAFDARPYAGASALVDPLAGHRRPCFATACAHSVFRR